MAEQYEFNVKDQLLDNRIIFLVGEISDESASDVKAKLLFLNNQNHKEITLYIDSPGGDIYSAFGIIDLMYFIESPVNTVCIGQADSAAAVILSSGDKRFSYPHSEIMIHEVGQEQIGGKTSELKNQVAAVNKANDMMSNILAQTTGRSTIKVREDIKNKDFYMTPKEAIEYGIIDEILQADKAVRRKKRILHIEKPESKVKKAAIKKKAKRKK